MLPEGFTGGLNQTPNSFRVERKWILKPERVRFRFKDGLNYRLNLPLNQSWTSFWEGCFKPYRGLKPNLKPFPVSGFKKRPLYQPKTFRILEIFKPSPKPFQVTGGVSKPTLKPFRVSRFTTEILNQTRNAFGFQKNEFKSNQKFFRVAKMRIYVNRIWNAFGFQNEKALTRNNPA